jgi:hypothetical protein
MSSQWPPCAHHDQPLGLCAIVLSIPPSCAACRNPAAGHTPRSCLHAIIALGMISAHRNWFSPCRAPRRVESNGSCNHAAIDRATPSSWPPRPAKLLPDTCSCSKMVVSAPVLGVADRLATSGSSTSTNSSLCPFVSSLRGRYFPRRDPGCARVQAVSMRSDARAWHGLACLGEWLTSKTAVL